MYFIYNCLFSLSVATRKYIESIGTGNIKRINSMLLAEAASTRCGLIEKQVKTRPTHTNPPLPLSLPQFLSISYSWYNNNCYVSGRGRLETCLGRLRQTEKARNTTEDTNLGT